MAERVLRRLEDGVGIVSLNRPEKHNAMDDAMGPEYRDAIAWAFETAEVRCVLLRGEGPSFCSGRDTTVLGHRERDESDYVFVRRAQDGRLAMQDAQKPVVAALRGHVIGGGAEMALGADMRVGASDMKLRLPEIYYGLLPDTGGTQLLTSLVGPAKAKYLVMTGAVIEAEEALAWGLIDWLVSPDEVDAKALDIARRIAAGPPIAVSMAKQLVDQAWGEVIRRGTRAELLAQTALFKTEDYQEARAARREGREPKYKGK